MKQATCADPDCDLAVHAKGWCKKHHARENYHANIEARRATQALYRARHREESKARAAAWRAANPERARDLRRRYYEANRDAIRESKRRYRDANRVKIRLSNQRRKQLERAARARGDLTSAQWTEIVDLFDHRCAYCGRDDRPLTQDHLVSLTQGGEHTASNVVPACQPCNSRKGDRPAPPFHPMFRQEE